MCCDNKWNVLRMVAPAEELLHSGDCRELSVLMHKVGCGVPLCASEKGALGERSEPDVLETERVDETSRKKDCAVPSSPPPPVEALPARSCVTYRLQATH